MIKMENKEELLKQLADFCKWFEQVAENQPELTAITDIDEEMDEDD